MTKKKFQSYSEMVNSNISWLGKIPNHWNKTKIKHCINFQTGWTPPSGKDEYYNGGYLWANISDLNKDKILNDTSKKISDKAIKDTNISIVPKGSLLFSFKLSIGQVAFAGVDMYTNEAIASFLDAPNVHLPYMYYALSEYVTKNANENIYGAKLLNQELIRNADIALPPLPEQQSIANFLDRKTGLIDDLTAKKELMIKLLKEKRQATITQAVTKGLDPYVEMDDSGIEWIGKKPKHWKVKSFKYFIEFVTSGSRGWASYYTDDGDIFIRIGNLTRDSIELDLSDIQYVTPPLGAEGERTKVIPGDILLSITAYLGSVAVVPENIDEAFVSQHVALARPTKQSVPNWLGFSILSSLVKTQLEMSAYGGTKIQLGLDDVKSLVIFEPPIAEQISIVSYLKTQDEKIASAISKITEQVLRLKEYRQSLIFNAVTGKIKVV